MSYWACALWTGAVCCTLRRAAVFTLPAPFRTICTVSAASAAQPGSGQVRELVRAVLGHQATSLHLQPAGGDVLPAVNVLNFEVHTGQRRIRGGSDRHPLPLSHGRHRERHRHQVVEGEQDGATSVTRRSSAHPVPTPDAPDTDPSTPPHREGT
jgi:hypothetical protein